MVLGLDSLVWLGGIAWQEMASGSAEHRAYGRVGDGVDVRITIRARVRVGARVGARAGARISIISKLLL